MTIDAPSRTHLPALRALWQEAFGDSDEFLNIFEKTAFSADRCRCLFIEGVLVAALYWFDCSCRGERIAYLYAIATAKAYRGRGFCSALMENTHIHLWKLGYEGSILVPGTKELFEFYKKSGYRVCSYVRELECKASCESLTLRQIDACEYGKLRRELLSEGDVVQENENLRFLQAQAELYTGEGFLLAARRDRETLFGIELLGDIKKAPNITRSLGCTQGRFRAPGADIPFAMYLPLGERMLTPPTYFGLAFD